MFDSEDDILQVLIETCKAKALESALIPSFDGVYKSFCRRYSIKFHTPLYLVYKMDPEEVIQTIFDDQYENYDVIEKIEEILEQIYTLESPDYKKQKEEDIVDFIKAAEEREIARIKRNKILEEDRKVIKIEEKPKQGSVDFSSLNNKNES